jgi:hypothetical protein
MMSTRIVDASFRCFAAATLTRARAYVREHMDEFEQWKEAKRNDDGPIQSQQAPAPHE